MIYMMILFFLIFVAQSFSCHYSCLTCNGSTESDCLTCSEGVTNQGKCSCSLGVYQSRICQSQCNQGYYQQLDQCLECQYGCKICQSVACDECLGNFVLVNTQFCSPHCEDSFYFLDNNCVSSLLSVQVSTLIHQSFHDGLDQCELDAAQFNFDQIITGNMCDFYDNYIIFKLEGNKNQKEVSLYLSNLLKHRFIRLYLKVFFIGQQKNNDFLQILIDGEKIFQYQQQGNQSSQNSFIEIKTNSTHNKSDLTLILRTKVNSALGIHNLQIISDICGCKSCDNNDECVQSVEWNNSICAENQQLINQQCINCELLQNRMPNCDCQIGYYLNETINTCEKCDIQCSTCKYQSDYCTDCNLNRVDPFICDCIEGYFENELKECQQCSQQCQTCYQKFDQCLTCKDQFLSPPYCQCQQNIVNNSDDYCQKCIKQEPIIELSSKLNQIIITFDNNFDLFSEKCSQIFFNETFISLGINPLCQKFDKQIKIFLGSSFSYTKKTPFLLNNSNIIMTNCIQPLLQVLPYHKISQIQEQNLILNYNYIQLSNRSEKTIIVQTNLSKVIEQRWNIVQFEREYSQIQKIVENWNNQLDLFYFQISGNQFNYNNSINLTFYYCDFSYSCGFQNLSIKIEMGTEIMNELLVHIQTSPIYEKQKVVIQIIYEDEDIQNNLSTSLQLTFNYSIQGKNVDIMASNETLNLNQSFLINIENNLLVKGEYYQIDIYGESQNKKYQNKIKFFIQPFPLNLKIQGGSKHVSFQQPLFLRLTINNNLLTDENNEFTQIIWSCKTLSDNKNCITYQNQQIITINNQTQIQIEKFSFEPYSVIEIFVQAIQMNILYQDQVTYFFIEENLPELEIITNNQVENQYNNDYDKIKFKLELSQKDFIIDQCIFTGSIIFDYEIKSFYQLYYPEFKIQLSDYLNLQQNEKLIYKFSVLLPQFTMPSHSSIQLLFNTPPKQCTLNVNEDKSQFPKLFQISVDGCEDENLPLQFRFSILIFSLNNKHSQQIFLNDFIYQNKITTLLINMMNSSQNITIIVDVLDRFLGLSHFQTELELDSQIFNDTDFIQLKEFFEQEQFYFQANYLIQYQDQKNLMTKSIIFEEIVKNMTQDNMKLIQTKLLLILSESHFYDLDNFLQNKIGQLSNIIDNQTNMQDGFQYFNQLKIDKEQQDLLELLNTYILQQNNKNQRPLRLLTDENNIQQSSVLQNFKKIGNLLLKQQTTNEKKTEYLYESFKFSTYKATDKQLNKSQIQIDLINNTFLQIQELGLIYNDMNQGLRQGNFQDNAYQMQMFDLSQENNTQISKIDNGSVSYEFFMGYNNDQNEEYHCVVNINENWQENQCTQIIDQNKIKCQCQDVALTSIKQVLLNFKSNLFYIFTEKNFQNIKRLNYVDVMFFYIQLHLTIFYVWFLFYGKKLDQLHIPSQQNKVYPMNKQTAAQLQKIKTIDNNENSPERQNCNHVMRITITSNKETFRALKETVTSNEQIQSDMSSPKSSSDIVNENGEQGKDIFTYQKNTSINPDEKTISMTDMNTIITSKKQFFQVFSKFYNNYHKIVALYFKYDKNQSRPFRATLLYLSLLGQMSFINWFGEIYDPITLITLSLLSYIFGLVYKKLLALFLASQIILLQYVGFLTASLSVIFFIFVTISTIPLYQNIFICNLWAVSYLISILVDLTFYTTLQILFMFLLLMKFRQYPTFQKILKRLLDPVCFTIIFTVTLQT